jgi:serine/threonine protein kinase
MDAERWRNLERLYHTALGREPEERGKFIAEACPGDEELRRELESLLRQDVAANSPLDRPAWENAASLLEYALTARLESGMQVGPYRIETPIGAGGMGRVYKAHDTRLGRDVALKVLREEVAEHHRLQSRFEIEARAVAALNHPNIVSIFDVGHAGDVSFIVSELVDGETLGRVIERGPLPVRRTVDIGQQVAEGLAAAHAVGVVHRDIKPANVILARGGRVKILDFGLARQGHTRGIENTMTDVSQPGVILGTPRYMSPEQVRGEATDARSDLFSLGLILYEMAAGRPAFHGPSSGEVMNSILEDDPPDLPATLPPALDRIIRRCTEKEPSKRFQSAADLAFALSTVCAPSSALPKPTTFVTPKRIALAFALVAVASALYWAGLHSHPVPKLAEITLRRLTTDSGLTTGATISPDGKLVAYASDRGASDNLDVYVQQVDSGGVVRITSDPADDYDPTFSADGAQIAFRSDREGSGIYIAPALGGEARLLVPKGRRPRFSPDGRLLMYYLGPENS